jgi:hypothetical protein
LSWPDPAGDYEHGTVGEIKWWSGEIGIETLDGTRYGFKELMELHGHLTVV